MKKQNPKVYVASPLGFAESTRQFYNEILLPAISAVGFEILDPWVLTADKVIKTATSLPYGQKRKDKWQEVNKVIGKNNADAIEKCDLIVAVLDGVDVDSGTASEIGYGSALGKPIIGYRGDFRLSADNEGSLVNLQVEYFIKKNNGATVTSLKELKSALIYFYGKKRN